MGTGWANAAGAQSIAQDTGNITNLLAARLMAGRIAAAQAQAQAMDTTGTEKVGPALASAAQNDFIARRKAMDPTETRLAKRDQDAADLKFKREQEQRLMGVDAETGRHNLADEGLKGSLQTETGRHNRAEEADTSSYHRGMLDVEGRKIDAALAKPGLKPATPAERQSLSFYNRAQDAVKTLTDAPADKPWGSLEMRIAKQGTAGQLQGQYAPNMLQTSEQQAYRQAQRAFTEARLRKESGAAIPLQEFENDARTYFAQPGDAPATIAQKQKARQTLLSGMKFAAGKAVAEFYGGDEGGGGSPASPAAPPPPGAPAAAKPSGIKSIMLVNP